MRHVIATFAALSAIVGQANADEIASPAFRRLDVNGDSQLTRDELPERARGNFDRADTNGDGVISPAEDAAFRSRAPRRQPNREPSLPDGYTLTRNVAYVEDGHERQVLDLYLPTASEIEPPLVVFIHGGGWRQGSKDRAPLRPLLEAGFAGAAINYRLSGQATFPAQIHDCKAAIRWLRSKATTYGYDGEAIGVWGTSAGGHLVALLGTSGDAQELEGEVGTRGVSSRVQAVCDYFGPTDLLRMDEQAGGRGPFRHNDANSPEAQLLGGPIQQRPDVAKRANPITYVTPDDPPFYLVHGDEDRLVPLGQSEILRDALDAAGVENQLRVVPGAGHGQFREPGIIESVVTFFERTLRKPRQ